MMLEWKLKKLVLACLFYVFCQIGCFSHYDSIHLESINQSKVHSCIIDHPLIVIELEQQNLRALQAATPRGFKIDGVFPTQTSTQINIPFLKKMFSIASNYFEYTIKVTQMEASLTIYPFGFYFCGVNVPTVYRTLGFDPSKTDTTIFIKLQTNIQQSYLAGAAPCVLARWPTYGFIQFNAAYFSTNLAKAGDFHLNVYTVVKICNIQIHQMTHIFGFSRSFWGYFYQSYTSTTLLGLSDVVSVVPGDNSKFMVITPSVKQFVQNFFACNDNSMGALLQNYGGSGSAGSHWERTIYYDQMMTASLWPTGLKVTPLTLSLLKDTGFYYSVDLTMSQQSYFGKGKGCDFAKGLVNPSPQFCTSGGSACGFYADYGGPCSSIDYFANSFSYVSAYQNLKCTIPESGVNSTHFNFSALSKCFMVNLGLVYQPHCYFSKCTTDGVQITVDGETRLCEGNTPTVSIGEATIQCPENQQNFCARTNCQNWCNTNGLCLRGDCMIPGQAYPTSPSPGGNTNTTSNGTNSTQNNTNTSEGSYWVIGIIVPVFVVLIIIIIAVVIKVKKTATINSSKAEAVGKSIDVLVDVQPISKPPMSSLNLHNPQNSREKEQL